MKIDALVSLRGKGTTKAECARLLRVDVRTIRRWLADPGVAQRVVAEQDEFYFELTASRVDAGREALPVLIGLMHNDDPKIQLRAVEIAYSRSNTGTETAMILRQLAELRAALGSESGGGWDDVESHV